MYSGRKGEYEDSKSPSRREAVSSRALLNVRCSESVQALPTTKVSKRG
jgi:hypothetical protein